MGSRVIAIVAVALVALAGTGLWMMTPASRGGTQPVKIGGPFSLIDGDGNKVTDRDFRGKFLLVYFGYTHCPDACPTTLSDIGAALDKLPAADRARVVALFVTVDPERDTAAMIGDYVHAFGPEFVGLTGSMSAIESAEREYRVYAVKHPLAHGDYAMDHSSIIYVIGPDGKFLSVIYDGTKPEDMSKRLIELGA